MMKINKYGFRLIWVGLGLLIAVISWGTDSLAQSTLSPAVKAAPKNAKEKVAWDQDPNVSQTDVLDHQLEAVINANVANPENRSFWDPLYHPQVTSQTFACLSYPYYLGGHNYADPQYDPLVKLTVNTGSIAEAAGDPNSSAILSEKQSLINALLLSCDLIHRWRQINESPVVALEVVRTAQLTQAGSYIYKIKPELAVEAKRTTGLIAGKNRNFDCSSRMMLRQLAVADSDKAILLEMEKQLVDLESLLSRLAEQNDAISVCLGIGKVDRMNPRVIFEERVDYSHYVLLSSPKPNPKSKP